MNNRIADEFRPDPENTGHFIPQGAHLFHDDARCDPVHAAAAPRFRIAASHQVAAAGFLKKFLRETDFILIHIEKHLFRDPLDQIAHFIPDP